MEGGKKEMEDGRREKEEMDNGKRVEKGDRRWKEGRKGG